MGRLELVLRIPDPNPADAGSTVRVAVRDTTMADALHPTVAETSARLEPGPEQRLSIELPDRLDPGRSYSLWAHVDRDGSGEIRAGDLITTQSIPVVAEARRRAPLEVPLTRV